MRFCRRNTLFFNGGLILLLCLYLAVAPAQAQESEDARIGEPVDPIGSELVVQPQFQRGSDSAIVPNHPPIDSIEPMLMPTPSSAERDATPSGPGDAVFHDGETGETQTFPAQLLSEVLAFQGGGFRGIAGHGDESEGGASTQGFGTKSLISDTALQSYPRSANVKLVMRFVDTSGDDVYSVCSGTMLDAGVVLTAGHCIHAAHRPAINDWAEEVWVYPAWDGVGSWSPSDTSHREYWGWARGTDLYAFTGWTENANLDWDAGMIQLRRTGPGNRQVGMLTSWFGWARDQECSDIQSRTYHNFSYPAESCPTSGLHTGRDMYYWKGSIDACPSNGRQLQIDTGDECMTAMWGGESGSSVYYIDNDSRYAHGVGSTSNRSSSGRYAKLWGNFIDYFHDTVRPGTRRDVADWELLRFRTGNPRIVRGRTTGPSTVYVANATDADPPQKQFTLRVYLSDNNNVTSADTLLATFNYTVDFTSMEMRIFNVPPVNIPANIAPGTYWLGAVIDVAGDAFPDNNNVWGWDAHEVEILSQELFEDRFER